MNRKSFTGVEIKDADQGQVTAVIATFGVVDKDFDVTHPDAFHDGEPLVISAYGHTSWDGELPIGKGVIRTTRTEALIDAQFFLDTAAGADTFKVVKNLGDLQEWSYGYDPLKFSYGDHDGQRVRFLEDVKAYEASPVLLGAGVGTRTLTAKGSVRLVDQAAAVVAAVNDLVERAADVMAKRQEKGKVLGEDTAERLAAVQAQLKRLEELLHPAPDAAPVIGEVHREFLRMLARR